MYAHNATGVTLGGNVDELIEDMKDAKDLRVLISCPASNNRQQWWTPTNVWIDDDKIGCFLDRVGITRDASNDNVVFQYPNDFWYFATFDTNGRLEEAAYKINRGVPQGNGAIQCSGEWFTRG